MDATIPSVRDYMTPNPYSIQSHESVLDAQRIMQDHGIRHLIVCRGDVLLGVVSERDLASFQGLPDASSSVIAVERALVSPPCTVDAQMTLSRVARELAEQRGDAAVVLDHGKAVGIFTNTNAFEALADVFEGKAARPAHEASSEGALRSGSTRPSTRERHPR